MASQVEEFLMPILEEEGPDDTLFQQDGAPPHFHKEVTDFFNRKFPEKWIAKGGLSLGHHVRLTLLSIFFWGGGRVHQGCCVRATIGYHFAGTCWEETRWSGFCYIDLLDNFWTEIENKYICRSTHGALIEHM
jgi:hypothetical protein